MTVPYADKIVVIGQSAISNGILQERLKSSTGVKSSVNLVKGVVQAPVLNSVKPRDPYVVGLERRLEQLEQLS